MIKPGLEPPPGTYSNFDNPNREMYTICIVSTVIAIPVCTAFVFLRLWARYRLKMKFEADDIVCIIGYVGFIGYCTICLLMLRYGGGLHQWDVPAPLIISYNKTVCATMVNYGPTVFATKAAILLLLTRVFAPYRTYVTWIYGFLGLMAIYYLIMLFLKVFICRPISMYWGGTTDGECFNQRLLILVDNVISLFSDVVVLLLPCPLIKDLKIGRMAKARIVVVFGVGGLACTFSLIRLVFIINNGETPDQTYAFLQVNLTGIAECGTGLVCACFPLMPALWKSILYKKELGHSSRAQSQFEMNNTSAKNSRNATHYRGTACYRSEFDSDETKLISEGRSHITTNVRAGGSSQRKTRYDESQIVVTVEVHQYDEN